MAKGYCPTLSTAMQVGAVRSNQMTDILVFLILCDGYITDFFIE